jgi:uncharacterized protein DUF1566
MKIPLILFTAVMIHASAFAGSYTDNGDGTVTDNVTTLMWQQNDDATARTWESAIAYCEGLSLAGHTDWRLPNAKELSSLVDDSTYHPAINTAYFPNVQLTYYWSSTTAVWTLGPAYAHIVEFDHGGGGSYVNKEKTDTFYVRCVR